jgi:hypothetical protein
MVLDSSEEVIDLVFRRKDSAHDIVIDPQVGSLGEILRRFDPKTGQIA